MSVPPFAVCRHCAVQDHSSHYYGWCEARVYNEAAGAWDCCACLEEPTPEPPTRPEQWQQAGVL